MSQAIFRYHANDTTASVPSAVATPTVLQVQQLSPTTAMTHVLTVSCPPSELPSSTAMALADSNEPAPRTAQLTTARKSQKK